MFGAVKQRHYHPARGSSKTMPFPKKFIPILSFLTVGILVWLFKPMIPVPTITWGPAVEEGILENLRRQDLGDKQKALVEKEQDRHSASRPVGGNPFQPGTVKPVGVSYTKMLVIARTSQEDVGWIEENFGENSGVDAAIYTVDDVEAPLHPPRNKGHEVMVYLSYVVDHYNNLSDVNIFMHSHRYSWHNNDILDNDAVQMVARLSSERVQREGYMNMRCSWEPGCPSWMHPGNVEQDVNKQEEVMLAKSWSELFPLDPIPEVLAQPCCAQFAISRDRIRSLPLARYVFYRDWLLRTTLPDYISGRVFEYVWQFIFTGKTIVCPAEHVCYCDGFRVCFGGAKEYDAYRVRVGERDKLQREVDMYRELSEKWESNPEKLTKEEKEQGPLEVGKDLEIQGKLAGVQAWCDKKEQDAKEHGDVAMNRAKEVGREWKDGDGF